MSKEEMFESCLPTAYDIEIKELYKNAYFPGFQDALSLGMFSVDLGNVHVNDGSNCSIGYHFSKGKQ